MSNQNSILLIDPTFDPTTAINCSLLVKIGMDNFSYAILNKESQKVSVVYDEQECENGLRKLSEQLKGHSYLSLPYADIKIAIYTENTISIPDSLYNSSDLPLHSKFFTPSCSENIYTTAHPSFGFTSVFSYSKLTEKIINQSLVSGKKYELNAPLLKLAEGTSTTSVVLDFTVGSIQLLYKKDNKIVFQRGYETENTEEFNYYILLIINQLTINLNETPVYVSGIIHMDDEKFNCLSKYFKQINFLNATNFSFDQQVLEDLPSHYYTSLLALDRCE